ncbi:hypothetical protein LTR70_007260 [Exophiala xenobiotica]|uniref:DUF7730 domain-containing protein n=1 Tax=Lithohypha guttulata TaxID=1690604 RepID=A0ABR0K6N8_9EURO|nr:hypothetical protein LTR24_006844 [Lithohypha guttulata]KAK5314286.1 hypothetical protein LTR70_007260 [Exophiala xenobiotica]
MAFLNLPLEIRLEIYSHLFGDVVAQVDGGRQDTGKESRAPSILPLPEKQLHQRQRSAQLLRTCKAILAEARPTLYQHTIFRINFQAFAGRLPVQMTGGHPSYALIRHLEWSISCDLLKKYEPMDVMISESDMHHLQSLQLTCQVENWRGSFCGEWCDREKFVRGRQQVIDFAKLLRSKMDSLAKPATLVEDVKYLSRGRVVLRLFRGKRIVKCDVSEQLSETIV